MPQARDRFIELLRRDILELDAAELDFDIYRVLNHRRATPACCCCPKRPPSTDC